jgi:hypothetical protein
MNRMRWAWLSRPRATAGISGFQRRAVSALGNLPAGKGVPILIEIAQTALDSA